MSNSAQRFGVWRLSRWTWYDPAGSAQFFVGNVFPCQHQCSLDSRRWYVGVHFGSLLYSSHAPGCGEVFPLDRLYAFDGYYFFTAFVPLGLAQPPLILFGVVDLLGAIWTGLALRSLKSN